MNEANASSRKKDHIDLAFDSQVRNMELDDRFYYEPLMSAHPKEVESIGFLGKKLRIPVWVSSMTGGTEMARKINTNLAKACREFGMGMGLGSCRSLLDGDEFLPDFNVRELIGDELPFYANLGIAQVEQLIRNGSTNKVPELLNKLRADGLFIHVNPLQEWLQPEGDQITVSPLETILGFMDLQPEISIIVKEVGQGMGRQSLEALMRIPVDAIEFAAHGGTNFSKLELLRNSEDSRDHFSGLSRIGHSADDMVDMVNDILGEDNGRDIRCRSFIVSGGVRDFLDGYYLTRKLNATAVYGQASTLLKYASKSYEELYQFLKNQVKGYALAEAYLRVRK